ncbi:hypothetical protein [uncultured Dubosiella sp.]|uniref:hypothetical protein n=1 Tax=uncultured Dubosiella sp. TaxID=1937011 RepID=UPI0025B4DA4C|nr:hypothetical protein [uncultured Dubosiella sp.]
MKKKRLYYGPALIDDFDIGSPLGTGNPMGCVIEWTSSGLRIRARHEEYAEILFGKGIREIVIPYVDMEKVTLSVCSRIWGMNLFTLGRKIYNFDVQILTKQWETMHLEFAACFEFWTILQRMSEQGATVRDVLNIYSMFPDKSSFEKGFGDYFETHFATLAEQYGLDDPRVGFTEGRM